MKLKLRVGVGDTLTIDVQPGDTFQDLSDRLFQLSGVQVDLSQLKSDDKPFNMSTNVIEYFAPKIEAERQKLPKLCRLCSHAITHDPHYIFDKNTGLCAAEKMNACLPLHVTLRDQLPKQICTICTKGLNTNYDFMRKVIMAQKSLENVFSVKNKNFPSGDCCPLCVVGKFSHIENRNGSIAGIRKESISQKDIGGLGVQQSDSSLSSVSNVIIEESEPSKKEFYLNDEVVTGYWDGNSSMVSSVNVPSPKFVEMYSPLELGQRRQRKRNRQDDDSEWTIDEEYLPVSRRGRPKGTKNKPKLPASLVEKSCVICGWLGPETDMLNHSLSQHCQPDLGYFPCPFCKTNHSTDVYLENHLATHNCAPFAT